MLYFQAYIYGFEDLINKVILIQTGNYNLYYSFLPVDFAK